MRNPNRTTKPERRAVRRYNRYAVRVLGIGEAARWHRDGILLDEAEGFENLVDDVLYGPVPGDLNDRVTAAYDAQRAEFERALGVGPGMLKSTSSNTNYHDMRQLEPGEWQTTVDATRRAPAVVTIPESLGGGTFTVPHRNGAHQANATFGALYQAYRKGRELGDAVELPTTPEFAPLKVSADYIAPVGGIEPEPLGPSACGHYEVFDTPMRVDAVLDITENNLTDLVDYAAWDGDPWRDPNEVAAVHAEAIENALNDDIDPGEQ